MFDYTSKAWHYDEFKQVGVDFESLEEVEEYDDGIGKGINIFDEVQDTADAVEMKCTDTVLEIGTATGELAIELSKMCKQIIAIDISEPMLIYARKKARQRGQDNIKFITAGFLTYQHEGPLFDSVISKMTLHHLPELWKMIAIKRVYDMLKPGGKFLLKDAILSLEIKNVNDFYTFMDEYVQGTRDVLGDKQADATAINCKEEYPMCLCSIEAILKTVGFSVDSITIHTGYLATIVCSKH